jgi:hypothetical protein
MDGLAADLRYVSSRYTLIKSNPLLPGATIGNDRRVYTDEEFALILRKAAELAQPADSSSHSSGGLTLDEMKAAAAQVGVDPALVERAARLVTAIGMAPPSFMERLFGGRARYSGEAHFPIVLDEAGVAQLMSAIRISVGHPGEGHSSALGLTWRSWDDGGAVFSLTAHTDHESTFVTTELDRRGTLAVVASMGGVGSVLAVLFGGNLLSALAPGFEPAGALLGLVGVLAVARSYWASSTRKARDRLSNVMESVSRLLTRPGNLTSGGERAVPTRTESERAGDAS